MSLTINTDDADELRDLATRLLSADELERTKYLLGETSGRAFIGGLSRDALDTLYREIGYLAALDAPGGRDSDFAKNSSQGAWAEGWT